MRRDQCFLSTIDPEAGNLARAHGLGVEIAHFCTAWNLDEQRTATDKQLAQTLKGISRRVLHGPFNELFPCAIDPRARQLARYRFGQALAAARQWGAQRVVLHGGFLPRVYYPSWFQEQSIAFWREFPIPQGMMVCLENVLEPDPELLLTIVREAENPGLGLCLDVGHANVYSTVSPQKWVEAWAGEIRHFHLHNNFGTQDSHQALLSGTIPIPALLEQAQALCPGATYTLEIPDAGPSVAWLEEYLF